MGNARFLITRSCSILKSYRLSCKLMNLREDRIFEEEKFTRKYICWEGKMWFLGDKLHRRDGPAVEWDDGDKEWWFEGKKHREDGPAIENADGYKAWWVDGERVE